MSATGQFAVTLERVRKSLRTWEPWKLKLPPSFGGTQSTWETMSLEDRHFCEAFEEIRVICAEASLAKLHKILEAAHKL